MSDINQINAHSYSDNYAIIQEEIGFCVGCEHNQTEAEALAKWLTYRSGIKYIVRRNSVDQVREAKQWFKQPIRHQLRDEAFSEMGIV